MLLPVRDAFVNRMTLAVMFEQYVAPFSAILTAIPLHADYAARNWVGNAFAVIFTRDGVWIFDSHDHPRSKAPLRGMVLARGEYDFQSGPQKKLHQAHTRLDLWNAAP